MFTGTGIERLVIPEGVTEIESNAFSGSSLREVVFPSTLTKIGSSAFSGTSLTTISLPSSVTTIESSAFSGTQLTTVTLPAGLTHLGDYAFGNISSLTSINIPKDINSDRNYYASYSPFSGSTNLTQISFDEGITVIPDYLFKDLSGLTELSIPSTVTTIGNGVFSGTGLREVVIPAGVTHIGYNAFDVDSLTKVTLPSSLESASSAFTGSPNLKEVVLTGNWTKIPSGLFTGTGIERLVIPEGVTEIESYAFSDSSLREVVFPSTLTKIGSSAFSGTPLTTISLPSSVTTIESSAFSSTQLTTVTLPAGLTHLGSSAFGNISSLTSVNIPKALNSDSNYYSSSSPFAGSNNLTQISFDEGITVIPDYLFKDLSGLVGMLIPEGVTAIGNSAFAYTNIADITLPTSLERIGSSAFSNTKLSSVIVPDNVKTIGSDAFRNTPLELVVLPREMTDLGSWAFAGTKLSILEIPEGITSIDDSLYADNEQLKRVYLPKSLTSFSRQRDWLITEEKPEEKIEYYVYIDSYALEYMIENQVPFKLRDENVSSDDSKLLDTGNSFYLATSSSSRREGYLGLDLKYSLKDGKASDDGTYKLRLNIPTTTSLYNGTVRLDGQDIPVTLENGYINLPVTAREGSLKLTLKANNNNLTNVQLFAQLAYEKDGRKTAETIGAVNVVVPVLQVTANAVTSRNYARITGIADPADSLVAYLDDVEVGPIKVKKDGTYQLDVPFTTLENNKEYLIRVEATSPDGHSLTASTTVRYEEGLPELENFIMRHNGYEYNLKEHGDKAPVISFRPGGKFEFEVEYTNYEQIENVFIVSIREGVEKYIRLTYDTSKGKYVYGGYFDEENYSYVPGQLDIRVVNRERRTHSLIIELEGEKIDYFSEDFKEKYKIVDEVANGSLIRRIYNRATDKIITQEEVSISLLEQLRHIYKEVQIQSKENEISEVGDFEDSDYFFRSSTSSDKVNYAEYITFLFIAEQLSPELVFNPADFVSGKLIDIIGELVSNSLKDIIASGKEGLGNFIGVAKHIDNSIEHLNLKKARDAINSAKGVTNQGVLEEFKQRNITLRASVAIEVIKEISNFVYRSFMINLLEEQLQDGKVNIPNYNNAQKLKEIEEAKRNFQWTSLNSIAIKVLEFNPLGKAVSIAHDFVASGINFFNSLDGKLQKWETVPTISGYPKSYYENIIDTLKIGAPSLFDAFKISKSANMMKKESLGTGGKIYDGNSPIQDNIFAPRFGNQLSSHSLPQIKYIIDPSGIITNADSNLPVRGATTTVYYRGENGEEVLWDAGEYSQLNPLSTTINGEYAWDVPEGYWKVKVEKEGYESAESEWLPVPPPQTEVHFKLKPHAYTITYNAGEGSMPTTGLVTTYKTDVAVALPQPTRKGYKFAGWFEDSSLTGVTYLDTLFLKPGDKTLFAKWERATKLLGTEAEDAFIHLQGDDVDKVARLVKAEQAVSTLAVDLPEGVQESDVQLLTIQLLDAEGQAVSLTEPARMEIGLETERPPVKVLTYNNQNNRFEEVVFDWDGDLKELQFDLQDTVNYLIVYQPLSVIITRTRQEVRILTTDQVLELEDSDLAQGQMREEASINGQVLVEITETLTDGQVTASSERELSRTDAVPRKIYRGTKIVIKLPDSAPTTPELPSVKIETKVRRVENVLTTDVVDYYDDPTLADHLTREESGTSGLLVTELTDYYVDGVLVRTDTKEISRTEATPKKVYRGTKHVTAVPDTAPTTPELPAVKIETKVRKVETVLTTDVVDYYDDATLADHLTREEPGTSGLLVTELTDYYVDGVLVRTDTKEISRTEATPKKVYRGTKHVTAVPDTAPTTPELPAVKIETKVRKVETVLTTDVVDYYDDATLADHLTREESGTSGLLVTELTDYYVDGVLVRTDTKEISRTEATPKKVYRGTKHVTAVPDTAPTTPELPAVKIETKVRKVETVLTTDVVDYYDDATLADHLTREEPGTSGLLVTELTDYYVDGVLVRTDTKEISRTEATPKKVYRGTKHVTQVPGSAPSAPILPTITIRKEERSITMSKIIHLEDADLVVGQIREEEGRPGFVIVEIIDYYVDGKVIKTEEVIVSREEPTPKILYHGTKPTDPINIPEPIQSDAGNSQAVEIQNIDSKRELPQTGQENSIFPSVLGLCLLSVGTALIKSRKDENSKG
ncbi:leucine-rich repeat protein [Streptococcus suis]